MNDGNRKVSRREKAHDLKRATSPVKHGRDNVMAQACMTASGSRSLVFIDDVTAVIVMHEGACKVLTL